MEYRDFGKTGVKVSILGFGAMRLPMTSSSDGKKIIKEEESIKMMHRAFELGINYIDTAYPYCRGQSETVVGKALKDWRDKVYVSTKLPIWMVNKTSDFKYFLEEQLRKLDVDYIDFYHFHSLNDDSFKEKVLKFKLPKEAEKAKTEGLIKHISFSFHDTPEVLKKIIDTGIFETVLCQYNILNQANGEAIDYAKRKGMGVAVMGPLGGGRVAALDLFHDIFRGKIKSIIELGLKFVFSNKNISTALSGMESVEMVEENVRVVNASHILTKDENEILKKSLERINIESLIPCSNCGYCMPCPNDVFIPKIFKIINYNTLTGFNADARLQYNNIALDKEYALADACTECGQCEEKCPQEIKIIDRLKDAHKLLKN